MWQIVRLNITQHRAVHISAWAYDTKQFHVKNHFSLQNFLSWFSINFRVTISQSGTSIVSTFCKFFLVHSSNVPTENNRMVMQNHGWHFAGGHFIDAAVKKHFVTRVNASKWNTTRITRPGEMAFPILKRFSWAVLQRSATPNNHPNVYSGIPSFPLVRSNRRGMFVKRHHITFQENRWFRLLVEYNQI